MDIEVHPQTNDPTTAWLSISKTQKCIKVNVTSQNSEIPPDKVRVVCMSDTHSLTPHIKFAIPPGDIFIHAGDFTQCGRLKEVEEFNNWLGELPHRHKIVIAGNHELSFDPSFTHPLTGLALIDKIPSLGVPKTSLCEAIKSTNIREQLTNCIYLEDSEVTLYGLKFYGSPWQPRYCDWAFNLPRGEECLRRWDLIPQDTAVLVTHTPPVGHGDRTCSGVRAGCVELLATVQRRVRPKYHVFGHIHEGYGISSDGQIIFINASTCDLNYLPTNPPIVFDITLPPGVKKV